MSLTEDLCYQCWLIYYCEKLVAIQLTEVDMIMTTWSIFLFMVFIGVYQQLLISIGHFAVGFFITTVDNSRNHSLTDLEDQYINALLTYYSHISVNFDLSNQPFIPELICESLCWGAGASLFSWSHDWPFLVSVNPDVLKNCSVNCDWNARVLETWTAKIILCTVHIDWRWIEEINSLIWPNNLN